MLNNFLAGLTIVGTVAALSVSAPTISGSARVIDGDTIQISNQRIRLWGIDAPEHDQPQGPAATAYLRNLVQANDVSCSPRDTDRYRRVVAQCFVMDRDIGLSMVASGNAIDYTRYSKGYYKDAENMAHKNGLGIWAGPFVAPEQWRHR